LLTFKNKLNLVDRVEEGKVTANSVCVLGEVDKESCCATPSGTGELQQSVADELLHLLLEVHE